MMEVLFNVDIVEYFMGWDLPAIICLVVGLLLLISEMFMPGFGVAGILGLLCLVAAVVLRADNMVTGLITLALILLIVLLFGVFFFRSFQKGKLSRTSLVLKDAIQSGPSSPQSQGSDLVGRRGVTLNALRPAGNADFGGQRLDVVSEASFLARGTAVRITRVDGNRIVVEPIREEKPVAAPVGEDAGGPAQE